MIADTLSEMILGYTIILGILVVYIFSLAIRFKRARSKNKAFSEDHHAS